MYSSLNGMNRLNVGDERTTTTTKRERWKGNGVCVYVCVGWEKCQGYKARFVFIPYSQECSSASPTHTSFFFPLIDLVCNLSEANVAREKTTFLKQLFRKCFALRILSKHTHTHTP